jgi:hypothetical protein
MEWLKSQVYSTFKPDILISDALEHFKKFDDPDLKCMLSDYYWFIGTHMISHRQIL